MEIATSEALILSSSFFEAHDSRAAKADREDSNEFSSLSSDGRHVKLSGLSANAWKRDRPELPENLLKST
jgi:hypothetical protein